MLYSHFTEKLLGLKDVIINNVKDNEESTEIYLEKSVKPHICPECGKSTSKVHDYRNQHIKDIPAFGKKTVLILHKRRYKCECGKCFYEKVDFLPRYRRMTNRFSAYVISKLSSVCSYTSVAKETGVSIPTIIRIFDLVQYGKSTLPEVLAIDEFKGNTGGEKCQCILTDPKTHVVLDILAKRYSSHLVDYFEPMERGKVKYFVSDMWRTYSDFSEAFFKNATPVIDKYHFIRQVTWAFEAVRKEEQKKFSKDHMVSETLSDSVTVSFTYFKISIQKRWRPLNTIAISSQIHFGGHHNI